MKNLVINLEELKKITMKYFEHLEEMNIKDIEIEHDYYWNIPSEQSFNISEDFSKPEITLGQLHDDWDFIKNDIEKENDELCSLSLAFHVVPLLEYIGWKEGI